MKKRIIAVGATIFGAVACVLGASSVKAVTTEVVTNDEFVFNANDLTSGYSKSNTVANASNVTLTMGSVFDGGACTANGFSFGDYTFNKVLLATPYSYSFFGYSFQTEFDGTKPAYYVEAPKDTKIGIYYTLVGTEKNEDTYYVSTDSTLEVVKETKSKRKTTYETLEIYTEESASMYYSEFTFENVTKVGIRSTDQYIGLFGLTIVTEEEISYRNEADLAIEALVNEYNNNGVSTNETFTTLVNNAKNAVLNVNHISQIDDYKSYVEILNLYEELVKVENSIYTLVDTNTKKSIHTVIKYDAESKALLDSVANDINSANSLGISNEMISNYYIYEAALAKYNQLEEDYNNAQVVVELINNLGDVEYTNEFKAQLDEIQNKYDSLINIDNVTNYDLYLSALEAFNQLSSDNVNAFKEKANLANELSGTKESYLALQDAKNAYDALIDADKANEEVVNAYNTLSDVETAYAEYEESVTECIDYLTYNEDGSVKSIFFIATLNNFESCDNLVSLNIYVENENASFKEVYSIGKVYKSITVSGNVVCEKVDGVRYFYYKLVNSDNEFENTAFVMNYEIVYTDGTVVTSDSITIEVK